MSAWLSNTGADIGLSLMAVGFVASPEAWRQMRHDRIFWSLPILLLYLLWGGWRATLEFPETYRLQYDQASNWFKLCAFLLLAFWLDGDRRKLHHILLLALLGLVAGMLSRMDWQAFLHFRLPPRTGFKLKWIFSGLVSATALNGLLLYAPVICAHGGWCAKKPILWLARAIWFVATLLMFYALLASQSRGAWLAAVIVIPVTVILFYREQVKQGIVARSVALTGTLVLAVAFGLMIHLNATKISKRFTREQVTVQTIIQSDHGYVPPTSLGYRVAIQRFGWQKWLERPWLGWGPGSVEYLISHSGNPRLLHDQTRGGQDWMDHLHNTYLEILVRFGLLGLVSVGGLVTIILRHVYRGWRSGQMATENFVFLVGSFGLLAIWNAFDFRVLHADWRAYWLIWAGACYSANVRFRHRHPGHTR